MFIESLLSLVITILFVFIFVAVYAVWDLPTYIFGRLHWVRDPVVMLIILVTLYTVVNQFILPFTNPYFVLPKTSINLLSNILLAFLGSLYAGHIK